MGNIVLVTQHSDRTTCAKSSDANAAALVAPSSCLCVAAVTQKIRRKFYRHGSGGNKRRPSPSLFPLLELAVAVALPLGCRCLRLRRLGRLGDEWPLLQSSTSLTCHPAVIVAAKGSLTTAAPPQRICTSARPLLRIIIMYYYYYCYTLITP